jgi:triphosphoribosyl-dephospho-CoA synthase
MTAMPSRARSAFLRACRLDVEVRKPGNVSVASPGHGMNAGLFIASSAAAAGPLFAAGARVGERIERAVAASWAAAGCNTNLGIVLLCAPIALAIERPGVLASAAALRSAINEVLGELDLEDARCAFRAIVRANPGGLGSAPEQDVRELPSEDLRSAMARSAERDSIAAQYANGFAGLFDVGLPVLKAGWSLMDGAQSDSVDAATRDQVQRVFLGFVAHRADSHIVRKHGDAVAHIVMSAAQGWRSRAHPGADPAWADWDESLKSSAINPGTSADLTVATLFVAGLLDAGQQAWHGS